MPYTFLEILSLAAVIFISGLIHGLVGFAFALTALPLLALIKEVKFAVPLLSLFSFSINLIMLIILHEKRIFKIPFYFFMVILLGVVLGVKGLTILSELTLRKILFGAILVYFLWEIYQLRINKTIKYITQINPKYFNSPLSLSVAFLVGLLGGLLNTPGPPIVIYLSMLRLDKDLLKATLQLIFAATSLMAAISHFLVGNLSKEIALLYLYLLPLAIIGLFIGQKFYLKLTNKVYYYLVNIFLLISAFLILLKPLH
ncbi:MAG: sulfite exporter TauE/SafE family protein [Caldimicrobium sp.]